MHSRNCSQPPKVYFKISGTTKEWSKIIRVDPKLEERLEHDSGRPIGKLIKEQKTHLYVAIIITHKDVFSFSPRCSRTAGSPALKLFNFILSLVCQFIVK
ncbi:MAG: hypothetical protein A3J63_03670 [Candidatus Moranbacteria bacterium RIFCSPHIGHO2_02_FULL_40_12b]|nr:MAG: hypothetical protein A3J63_03670 [Candidatus Moranbacteria bacterium RIFCSPHIGHO2_02_FULL_40_12b]OGI23171.1 MAG: hypothetical protein A3E91_03130 [Candidatus Moranbacteria bacterium RIFCSPHIGHO2_12_FULL_40_10]